jgi:hypothetical protein
MPRNGKVPGSAYSGSRLLSDAASWVTATTLTIDGGVSRSLFNYMKGRKWS